ncbi:MAG TPA: hypothetical protein VLM75_02810 [Spirochaetota bacterium]|nr:hypothetical protein [Spirochaetota bacterium]
MTMIKNLKIAVSALTVALSACLVLSTGAKAAFLLDKEAPARVEKTEPVAPARAGSEFPPHIATNIKAQPVAGVRGAIRISWDADPTAPNDFIVGRSMEIPDTAGKAVAARSIKIVPAAPGSSVIDTNLPPGRYYYVVLAREKVMSHDVEVYPDVNYTVNPVVMERDEPISTRPVLPDQVALIHAQAINQTHVALSWKGVSGQGITYTVYRGTQPLSTPERLKSADSVATITDGRESYTDRGIQATGNYYYAVTTRDIAGNEDFQLTPDQSYMTKGVYVAFISEATVSGLKAIPGDDGSIRLTWKGVGSGSVEYLVYRYNRPITDVQRLALATQLGVVRAGVEEYIDNNPGRDVHYYAVFVRFQDSSIENTIKQGQNCTIDPVAARRKAVAQKEPPVIIAPPAKKEIARPIPVETGTVDAILRETFFKEKYSASAKKLGDVVRTSDNETEVAKARLFIGRSLVEMRQYRKAIDYFLMPDVKKHFSREAKFWSEYAISRTR